MTTTIQQPADSSATVPRRRTRWMVVVSAFLAAWLCAQAIAGWKFANGTTYPVVGSAMFNGPPIGSGRDYMSSRVFAVTASGERVEMDQLTFGLEAFEWRRWIKRHLDQVDDAHAAQAAKDLARAYVDAEPGAAEPVAIELWRVPALNDHLRDGRIVRAVRL